MKFSGNIKWRNRRGDVELVRSFETTQRTPKTDSGSESYGQKRESVFMLGKECGSTAPDPVVPEAR